MDDHATHEPPLWLLQTGQCGDDAQGLALGEALGRPFTVKPARDADSLVPPWPAVVISAGRHGEAAVRELRRRAGTAPVRFVHVGRPYHSHAREFDLVVTTPDYRVPPAPNVLEIPLPLHRVTPARLAEGRRRWGPCLTHLPAPYVALLVGGAGSGRYSLDRTVALRLARAASGLAARRGGSLLVTTSHRTPPGIADAIEAHLTAPSAFHRWRPGLPDDNPYFGYLGLASEIVVTGDSVSMLAEAAATGRPVHLFDLEPRGAEALLSGRDLLVWMRTRLHEAAQSCLPRRLRRDIRVIHARLLAGGRVVRLGEGAVRTSATLPDYGPVVAERVLSLLTSGPVPIIRSVGDRPRSATVGWALRRLPGPSTPARAAGTAA